MVIRILIYVIQSIGIWVPLVGCVSLIRKVQSRASMYLLLANLGCLIINGSYMLLLQTGTFDGALVALKMEYFGNVFFYLMFAVFLWTYLRMKRHGWVKGIFGVWCVLDVLFLTSIWTMDGFPVVFETLQFDRRFGLTLVQIRPGTLYMLRYSVMCMLMLWGMLYTTVRVFLAKAVPERKNLAKLAGAQMVIWSSLISVLLFKLPFDIAPFCTSLSILSIIISVQRDEFFGAAEIGREWVFEQMEDAFVLVDEMYGYLDSNAYARKVFAELNSMRKSKAVKGELYELFTAPDRIHRIEGKYYNKKIMEIREKGVLSGYCLLLVDITEQYELTERVREEKERADAANQAKSAFVSNVSHEIRTPMNAIVGMAQIMLRRDLPAQDREYLMNIQNSGNALLAIVNDLLDMSKIEAGKMELVDEEYDFMAMLGDLGMIILNRIGAKPVELLYDIDPDIPARLYGDALRIRQIIINLMNNATKFTEEGYVCLAVRVNQIQQEDLELSISVKDTGQGIRKEDLGRLFGTFQQVDTQKNHHKEGTGLGLSISRQLVELMHGSIGVDSEYGKGSEFYFTIHQRIVDGRRAARLAEGRQAVAVGGMRSEAANEMLRKLAGAYGIAYAADVASAAGLVSASGAVGEAENSSAAGNASAAGLAGVAGAVGEAENAGAAGNAGASGVASAAGLAGASGVAGAADSAGRLGLPVYYFTDSYEALGDEEKRALSALGAVVCGMQNPMAATDFPEGMLTMNKPLYSGNFCNLLEGRTGQGQEPEEGAAGESARDGGKGGMDFLAPQACVLIVDDNEINCMVAEEMLKPLQMQIDLASDGRQALDMVRKKDYDIVLMDHFMPVMNGIDAAKAIRKLDGARWREIPIIALTANTAKEQQEEYRKAGMSDFLSKPIDMTELYKIVKKWIPDKIQ